MSERADERPVSETVRAVLADHSVAVGSLFGSHARGDADAMSDIDVAVAFEDCNPGDPGYADRRLALGVHKSELLCSPSDISAV